MSVVSAKGPFGWIMLDRADTSLRSLTRRPLELTHAPHDVSASAYDDQSRARLALADALLDVDAAFAQTGGDASELAG